MKGTRYETQKGNYFFGSLTVLGMFFLEQKRIPVFCKRIRVGKLPSHTQKQNLINTLPKRFPKDPRTSKSLVAGVADPHLALAHLGGQLVRHLRLGLSTGRRFDGSFYVGGGSRG